MAAFSKIDACFRLALLLTLALAQATATRAERLPIKTYTTADGLARDQINRIVRDSRGFLWFCTDEGISRFDGYTFTTYGIEEGLPHRNVADILKTREGVYWVATSGGVCRFNPALASQSQAYPLLENLRGPDRSVASEPRFAVYPLSGTERAQFVNTLLQDRAGTIWCGTDAGLYRLEQMNDQAGFTYTEIGFPKTEYDDSTVNIMIEDRRGEMWVGAGSGLYRRFADGRVERYTTQDGLPYNDVRSLLEDRQGQLWVGTTLGLCRIAFQPGSTRPVVARVYNAKDGLSTNWVTSLLEASDGRVWVANTELNLFISSPDKRERFQKYTTEHGLSSNTVTALAEDEDGNLWMGSRGGAMKMGRNGLITYGKADGFTNTAIRSIFENHLGELFVVDGNGINRSDGKRFIPVKTRLPKDINTSWGWNQIHFQDKTGRWWVPTLDGLYVYPKVSNVERLADTRPEAVYTIRDGLSGNQIFRIYEDSRGDIWISTLDGVGRVLSRWERATGKFHRYPEADGQPLQSAPTAFREDAAGNIWIGFYTGGVARYSAGRLTFLTIGDGLPAGMIREIFLDHSGRLWVAMSQGGLARVDEPSADRPRFVRYAVAEGLSSNQVTCITEDQWGRIYVGTGRGLDRLDPASGHTRHYTSADGLGHNLTAAAYRDREGALWFGTADGLSRLVPELDRTRPPPPILISGLRIAGFTYPVSDLGEPEIPGVELNASQNQIEIDFFGISFSPGEALRYQYKLEGSDQDWKSLTAARTVNYASLSPGAYRFLVRAVSADGALSQSPAAVSFNILPPIWRRWWFVTLAAILVAGVIFSFDRYRATRMRAIKESEDRFRTLAETASDAIITINEESRIIFVNPAAETVFGYTIQEMLGADLVMLMPEYLRHLHRAGFARYAETGKRHLSWASIELPGLHKSGREIPLEISFGEFVRNDKHFFTGVARDITERKRAEEALIRSKEERLVELERVRKRIATDLHDDIGSSLTRISLLSEVVSQQVGQQVGRAGMPFVEPLSMIAGLSRELVDSMSDIVWAINPKKDRLGDLSQRMRHFASDVLTARRVEFVFRAPDAERDVQIGANVRREIFLIFKESVNNLVRHSGCTKAGIEFRLSADCLVLVVTDNGRGFDVLRESDGHGLLSMQERTKGLGGTLAISSERDHGTTLTLTVPLNQVVEDINGNHP